MKANNSQACLQQVLPLDLARGPFVLRKRTLESWGEKELPFPDPVQKFLPQHTHQMTAQSLLEYLQLWGTHYLSRQPFKH